MFKEFLLLLLGALVLVHFTGADIDLDTKEKIETGLSTMSDIVGILKDSDIPKKVEEFTRKLSDGIMAKRTLRTLSFAASAVPYLQAVGPLVELVLLFVPSQDDPMMKEMREQFQEVNRKLDQITDKLGHVDRTVAWHVDRSKFQQHARTIRIFKNKLVELSKSNSPQEKRQQMIEEYKTDYKDAGENLKIMVVGEGSDSIIELYKSYTKQHRREVAKFMMQAMGSLTEASQIEVAFMKLMGYSDVHIQDEISHWEEFIRQVEKKMNEIDDSFTVKTAKEEYRKYVNDHKRSQNARDLTTNVYKLLEDKYYWKKWLVVTYKDASQWWVTLPSSSDIWSFKLWNENHMRQMRVFHVDRDRRFSSNSAQKQLNSYKNSRDHYDGKRTRCGWLKKRTRFCPITDSKCKEKNRKPSALVYNEITSKVDGEAYAFVIKECGDLHVSHTPGSYASAFWTHRCWSGDCKKWHTLVFG